MKFLVVDDNENTRVLQKTVLESDGHIVDTASNGKEALEAAGRSVPDMIISDILMPEMDGFELCRAIRVDERFKYLPLLLMTTTYTEPGDEKLALDIGASRFVIRPMDPSEFLSIVYEVLKEHKREGEVSGIPIVELEEAHDRVVARKLDKKVRELEAEREALKESEAKYRRLIEGLKADYFFYSHDTKGIFTYLSPSIKNVIGYSQYEFLTHYSEYLTDNPVNKEVERKTELAIKGEEQPAYEIEIYHKDGGTRWLEVKETPLIDERGKVVSVEGIAHDITGRKQAEEVLRESEEKYEDLYENAPSMFASVSAKTAEIVRCNRTTAEALGYTKEELIGQAIFFVYHPDCMEEVKKAFVSFVETGEVHDTELQLKRKDGSKIDVLLNVSSVRNEWGNVLYSRSVWRDITKLKEAEKKMREEMELNRNLLKISEATAQTTDVGRLMHEVVECVRGVLGADLCLSYLWEKEAGVFKATAGASLSHEMIPSFMTRALNKDGALIKKVLGKRLPVVASFTSEEGRTGIEELALSGWIDDIGAIVIIPLIGRSAPTGLLVGVYGQEKEKAAESITEKKNVLIKGISNQVSTALEEANLYEESFKKTMSLTRMVEVIKTMHEIDRSILSTLEPREILDTTVKMVSRIVACDIASVLLLRPEGEGLVYAAGFGAFTEHKMDESIDDPPVERVLHTLRPEYIPHESVWRGCRSRLLIPLIVKGRGIGVLTVGSNRPAAFTPTDISTLEKLSTQLGVALENARLVEDLEGLFLGTLRSLSEAIDAKSPWTRGHSERVTEYALKIASEMGLEGKELKVLERAGLLHDIGKLGTYEYILEKPDKLTEEEIKIINQHPEKGVEILEPIRQLKEILPVIKSHHEYYDGSGYPTGLKGEKIPLMSRILTVADTVDAMGADRPYRKGMPMEEIIDELKRCSGTQFDPKVVEAYLEVLKKSSN